MTASLLGTVREHVNSQAFAFDTIGTVLSVFILLFVGYGTKKLKILKVENAGVLNDIVIYLALPSFIFTAVYNYKQAIPAAMGKATLIGFGMIMVVAFSAYMIGRLIKLDRSNLPGFILAAAFGNTGFMGYPIVEAVFPNKAALVTAVLYDELAMALPLYVLGIVLVAAFAGEKTDHRQVVRALKMPQLWAIPIALFLRQFHVPQPVIVAIDYLGRSTIPLVMISIGLTLSANSLKGYAAPITAICLLKLAVLPIITSYALRAGGLNGVIHQSTVLEAGMPTAMMAGVLVSKFGKNGEFMAGLIFVTTLLSIITIPITLLILGVRVN